ncbi:prepilin peptidase [Cellvibrio mixtus]|uniref:Prepilin leader peptidase/N-methyltransferase n=1 Tax=Cellvibrio mixtus TaxID=39650 RepID=A0A266Q292_9GAMM|nr:A24 family peptidase [Cellvibrio mixtus]OZY83984.1 prepilin peptidase [Cellvibrio mixtus]
MACALVLGLLVGSFLNVVIYRLPKMMERDWQHQCREFLANDSNIATLPESNEKQETFNLMVPASRCPNCGHKIRAWENIPVISYVFLGGKCSSCKTTISIRYPIIELATGILSVVAIAYFGVSWNGLAALLLTWSLIALTMIDLDTYLLPDDITLPLLWLGLIINSFGMFTDLPSALWGAIAGYMSLWMVYQLFKLVTGKEGMGFGDFKLLAALGAWMGWQMLPQIILLSSLVGAVIGITMIVVRGRDKNIPIPFGPYLAIAGWIAFIWGDTINQAYLKLFVVH